MKYFRKIIGVLILINILPSLIWMGGGFKASGNPDRFDLFLCRFHPLVQGLMLEGICVLILGLFLVGMLVFDPKLLK